MKAKDRIIVALDYSELKDVRALVKKLGNRVGYYKVGLELFISHGWKAVEIIKKSGAKVFLDLKLHDIPNTVAKALKSACDHDVDIVNVHALGGHDMMKRAIDILPKKRKTKVIAVTILTSHDENTLKKELKIDSKVQTQVMHLARMTEKAGLDGVVCSPKEVKAIKKKFPKFVAVTPGVRPAWSAKNDQKRICTPADALSLGADYLVIGRPITLAEDPIQASEDIIKEINGAVS